MDVSFIYASVPNPGASVDFGETLLFRLRCKISAASTFYKSVPIISPLIHLQIFVH